MKVEITERWRLLRKSKAGKSAKALLCLEKRWMWSWEYTNVELLAVVSRFGIFRCGVIMCLCFLFKNR